MWAMWETRRKDFVYTLLFALGHLFLGRQQYTSFVRLMKDARRNLRNARACLFGMWYKQSNAVPLPHSHKTFFQSRCSLPPNFY
jgi:hypothetical protein